MLALQMGKLKKGATPDRELAARIGRNMTKFNSMDNFFYGHIGPTHFWSARPSLVAFKAT